LSSYAAGCHPDHDTLATIRHRFLDELAGAFLLPTLPRIIQAMVREGAFASPTLWLLCFTLAALEQFHPPPEPAS